MNACTNALVITILFIAAHISIIPSALGYSYDIKNYTPKSVQIYITGKDWGSQSKNNNDGNLAIAADGTIDKEGKARTLQPQETTTYWFDKEDKRSEICMQDLMIRLQDQPNFVAATQKGNLPQGCSNQSINILIDDGKAVACYKVGQEPAIRGFKIINATSTPAEIYITAKGWQYVSKGSGGNLAYDAGPDPDPEHRVDKEGKTRTLKPNESTIYSWADNRLGFCIGSLMVKFQNQTDFVTATQKNNTKKGCANQVVTLTREGDQPVATFNFFPVDEHLIERIPK